jgi:hypothetical protein
MHDIKIDGRPKQVPADWNELTRPLLLELLLALYSPADSPTQLRLRVLRVALQLSWDLLLECTDVQLAQLLWLADPFVNEVRLTRQLLPTLQAPGLARWWAPRENFCNLRLLEFILADAYFVAFSQDLTRLDYLDQLVGVLYRPERKPYRPHAPDYGGDRREGFNPAHVASRAAGLKDKLLSEKPAARRRAQVEAAGGQYRHGRRLTDEAVVAEVRWLKGEGLSMRKIAEATGASVGTVHKYLG